MNEGLAPDFAAINAGGPAPAVDVLLVGEPVPEAAGGPAPVPLDVEPMCKHVPALADVPADGGCGTCG